MNCEAWQWVTGTGNGEKNDLAPNHRQNRNDMAEMI